LCLKILDNTEEGRANPFGGTSAANGLLQKVESTDSLVIRKGALVSVVDQGGGSHSFTKVKSSVPDS
jgi:hypothetical protein